MAGWYRDRDRRPARRAAFRETRERILVLCEGERTEPEYLRGFIGAHRSHGVKVEVTPGPGLPLGLVDRAKVRKQGAEADARRGRDDNLKFDQVWCVFDVDQHPHLEAAVDLARTNGIELAISNPCFELWLWLHLYDSPGHHGHRALQAKWAKVSPKEGKGVDFAGIAAGYDEAVRRAQRLHADAEAEGPAHLTNPTTGVWRLTERIRG